MGTIADKLNYLNTTKSQIKTALTNKGVSISDTDTFRSYVDKINGITVSKTQTKTQSITENKTYTVKPDSGYTGLSTVTVTPATETKNVSITSSGTTTVTPSSGKVGLTSVAITPATQTKSTTITSNGTTTIKPDSGKVGLTSVSITTNVPQPQYGPTYNTNVIFSGVGSTSNISKSGSFTIPANKNCEVFVVGVTAGSHSFSCKAGGVNISGNSIFSEVGSVFGGSLRTTVTRFWIGRSTSARTCNVSYDNGAGVGCCAFYVM